MARRRDPFDTGMIVIIKWLAQRPYLRSAIVIGMGMVGAVSIRFAETRKPEGPRVELVDRIQSLTTSLNASAKSISEIEIEMAKRKALVDQLQKDAQIAERLAAVNKEQAEAIAQTLSRQLDAQVERSYWSSQFYNLLYACLGVFLAELFHFLKRRWPRQSS